MILKSGRPLYAILLFALSSLWMCAIFLPLLSFVVSPDENLRRFVQALEDHGLPPPEAAATVKETIDAVGPLTSAVPVAYYSGVSTTVRASGSETIRKRQVSYLAHFQKHPKSLLLVVTSYEGTGGQSAYEINEGEAMFLVRGYTLPVLVFVVSLFLLLKKKPNGSLQGRL